MSEDTSPGSEGARQAPGEAERQLLLDDAREQLRQREQLFRAVFDASLDGIVLLDDAGTYVDANPAACALFGAPKACLVGRKAEDFAAPGMDVPARREAFLAAGHQSDYFSLLRADGLVLQLEYTATTNILPGLHLATVRDVTERQRVAQALRESEQNYRQIVDAAREGIWRIDAESRTTFVNRALTEMLGYSAEEMLGRVVFDFMDEEGRALTGGGIARRKQGIAESHQNKYIRKDGSVMWAVVHASPLLDEGRYTGGLAMVTDNTVRRATEEALRASEEKYRLLFDCSPLAKWLTDTKTLRFIAVNGAACELWGYSKEELIGMPAQQIVHPSDLPSAIRAIAATPPDRALRGTWRHRRKDGSLIDVDVHAHTFVLDGRQVRMTVGQDVTVRKRLEAQLMQAQKMEAVGLLAGGIAHDFNNLLSVVATYSSFMLDALKPGDPLRDDVKEVAKASERALALTKQLLAFGRQQILQPRILDLNESISGILNMLRRLLGEGIELSFINGAALGAVNADPGQIEQLLMNLVVNARDAMPDGGTLTIETRNVELEVAYVAEHPGSQPGRHVMLSLTDTGVGIDSATRERIFEPFFTTKELGKGTGLGLPTVLGITQQSGGSVSVTSELGRGTTFNICLPAVRGAIVRAESIAPGVPSRSGTETVLLVEDDDQVRQLVRTILRRHGYRVLDARNGGEAFLMCEQEPGLIDLLLTDVVMPKMSGFQLAERLQPMRPAMKVLFMSGHTSDATLHRRVLDADVPFLQKPITPDNLSHRVREVLDRT
jgi:PAS domain S-box-containing protein